MAYDSSLQGDTSAATSPAPATMGIALSLTSICFRAVRSRVVGN
jgi:hypothetical protein